MYKRLMSKNDNPVNWNCEDEYANNLAESTTALHTQTKGNLEKQINQNTLLLAMLHCVNL